VRLKAKVPVLHGLGGGDGSAGGRSTRLVAGPPARHRDRAVPPVPHGLPVAGAGWTPPHRPPRSVRLLSHQRPDGHGQVRELIKVPRDQQGVLLVAVDEAAVLGEGEFDVSALPLTHMPCH
jgi:hypothetical protein